MKKGYVRQGKIDDAVELAPKMRAADVLEIKRSDNTSPLEALLTPFTMKKSKTYSIISENEEVIGMFGSTFTELPGYGTAWMLCSEELFEYTIQFLRECPYWVQEMGKEYDYLFNFVDKENVVALRWLKYLGFTEDKEIAEYGAGKTPFIFVLKTMDKEAQQCVM